MFNGVYTALITPFDKNGKIDYKALETLIEKQLAAGIDGLVLLGTTAESATLTAQEKNDLLSAATKQINKRVKVIIGCGTNSTDTTVETAKSVLPFDPDGILIVTPYYNKPNPSGLIAHFQKVAELGKPIVLYHIPGRTGLKLSLTVMRDLLNAVPQIKAVKESDYDFGFVTDMAVSFQNRIEYICGNDDVFPQFLSLNSPGIVSAAGNVLAPAFVKIYKAFKAGKTKEAFEIFTKAYPFIKACYFETNPTCGKYFLEKLGYCSAQCRLPLGPISDENKAKIDALFENADRSLFI